MTTCSTLCAPRWATARTDRESYGGQAARFAEALGFELMDWQRLVLDVALEHDKTGRLVYREVCLTVPRQSGKTTLLLVLIMWRSLFWDGQISVYTAQDGRSAQNKWTDDWVPRLKRSPLAKYFKPRLLNGSNALLFTNGSQQHVIATTESSGHGMTVDMAILDEVFDYQDGRLEQAMKPAMVTRKSAQFWTVSTAGAPGKSPYLWEKVDRGRQAVEAGVTKGICYFEWSAAEDADPADPETWRSCMPALGVTVDEEIIGSDFASMAVNEFRRAYLNQWTLSMGDPVIPIDAWDACLDSRSSPERGLWFAPDVSTDRLNASIAVCGARRDGVPHVEVVDCRPGTDWVVPRLVELRAAHHPQGIVIDKGGPAKSLLPEIEKAGLEASEITMAEYGAACGFIFDAVMSRKVRHLDDKRLVSALSGAQKRPLGEAWAWQRRNPSCDVTPLVASTLALWAHSQAPEPSKAGGVWVGDGGKDDPEDRGTWVALVAEEDDW